MKEILEIVRKAMSICFEMGLKQSPTDAENSEFYRPMIDLSMAPKTTSEIEALIKENYYPKELVEWLRTENTLNEKLNDWICERITSDELYEYWFTNIKDK